jgi:hypothetical protein
MTIVSKAQYPSSYTNKLTPSTVERLNKMKVREETWDQLFTRLMDSLDNQMSAIEEETLRILQEKKKRMESRKR